MNLRRFTRRYRIAQGDLRRSSKTRKVSGFLQVRASSKMNALGKPTPSPYSNARGKPEALSQSAVTEEKNQLVRGSLRCGVEAHRFQYCGAKSGCHRRSGPRMGQVEKSTGLGHQESQTQVGGSSTSEKRRKICSFRIPHGPLPSQTLRACQTSRTIQGERRAPGRTTSKTTVEHDRSTQITAIPETKTSTRVDETRTRFKTQWFPFERNLYIHPLAGFLWERESSKKYISSTTGKVRGENVCMSIEKSQPVLSVYVDGIKMVGRRTLRTHVGKSAKSNRPGRSEPCG